MFAGESVNHAIVRLHLQGDTQAAIKQKIHCGSSTVVDAIRYFNDHNAIKPEGQKGRPSKITNPVLETYVQMQTCSYKRMGFNTNVTH